MGSLGEIGAKASAEKIRSVSLENKRDPLVLSQRIEIGSYAQER